MEQPTSRAKWKRHSEEERHFRFSSQSSGHYRTTTKSKFYKREVSLLILGVFILLIVSFILNSSSFQNVMLRFFSSNRRYGIMVDMGSSGSRVYVLTWYQSTPDDSAVKCSEYNYYFFEELFIKGNELILLILEIQV